MVRRALLIVLLMLVCYSYVLPRWADWSQTSRLALVRAVVEQGTLRIDAYVSSTGDYALIDGHAYSDKAPGPALLAVPVYAAVWHASHLPFAEQILSRVAHSGAFAGTLDAQSAGLGLERVRLAFSHYAVTMIVIALPAALAVAALDQILRRWFASGPALLGALGYGVATPAAAYAGNLYSHALVAALLVGGWWLIEQAGEEHRHRALRLAGAGLLLGWATISEYPAVVLCAALGVYAMYRLGWRAAAWLVVGGVPALGVLAMYDLLAFGTPWPIAYAHSALWQGQHHTGVISLTYPHPAALWGLLAGPFRGLWIRSPWLVLALPGAILWWRSTQHRAVLVLCACAFVSLWLLYGSSGMWWGGFAVGPRYIVAALPFAAVLATWWIDRVWQRRAWRVVAIGSVIVSTVLVWAETLAGQEFPPDTIGNPWIGWTLPAWQNGDVARNAGMALGLHGVWSVVPLAVIALIVLTFLLRSPRHRKPVQRLDPVPSR